MLVVVSSSSSFIIGIGKNNISYWNIECRRGFLLNSGATCVLADTCRLVLDTVQDDLLARS